MATTSTITYTTEANTIKLTMPNGAIRSMQIAEGLALGDLQTSDPVAHAAMTTASASGIVTVSAT